MAEAAQLKQRAAAAVARHQQPRPQVRPALVARLEDWQEAPAAAVSAPSVRAEAHRQDPTCSKAIACLCAFD